MDVILLIGAMVAVGLLVAALAGAIWRGPRPYGLTGDILVSVAVAVVVGLLDWFVIPALNFSQTVVLLGVAIEPPLASLVVLWLLRRAKKG